MREIITVGQAMADYLAERRDEVIRSDHITLAFSRLQDRFGPIDVEDRDAIDRAVAEHVTDAVRTIAPASIRRHLVPLQAALTRLWRRGRMSYQPHLVLPPHGKPAERWLTPDEARTLIKGANPRIVLFLRIALATGARLTALLELTWDRVDLQHGIIDFRAPHPLEHRRKRRAVVPIAPQIVAELRAARLGAGDERRVFPFVASNLRRMFRSACRRAKLGRDVRIHTLRHSAATWMLAGDVPLVKVSKMLGHSATAVTEQVYGHVGPAHMREIARLMADTLGSQAADG